MNEPTETVAAARPRGGLLIIFTALMLAILEGLERLLADWLPGQDADLAHMLDRMR